MASPRPTWATWDPSQNVRREGKMLRLGVQTPPAKDNSVPAPTASSYSLTSAPEIWHCRLQWAHKSKHESMAQQVRVTCASLMTWVWSSQPYRTLKGMEPKPSSASHTRAAPHPRAHPHSIFKRHHSFALQLVSSHRFACSYPSGSLKHRELISRDSDVSNNQPLTGSPNTSVIQPVK